MPRKFPKLLYGLLLLWIGLCICCLYIPPYVWWLAGFVAMTLPVALCLNLVFLLFWLFSRKWAAVIPLGVVVLCLGLYTRGFNLSFTPANPPENARALKLLSYNVRVFNIYPHLHSKDDHEITELFDFVNNHTADVLCLQEYYNGHSSRPRSQNNLLTTKLLKKNRPYFSVVVSDLNSQKDEFGLAIFSRFKIINKGKLNFSGKTSNQAMFVDIKMPQDTVRVYNFHLQSMYIDENHLPEVNNDKVAFRRNLTNLYRRVRRGMAMRSEQVQLLREHMLQSPHPVIATGDLNDVPFSYTYQYMLRKFNNAFEEAGNGLGITYAGRLPLLRIDNHFVSPEIETVSFETQADASHTDHYPTYGVYLLPEE